MDFELTEEQAMLREVSRSMLTASCPPELVRSLAGSDKDLDDKLWQRGVELGWTGLAVPEGLNGSGQGLVELCLVAEEIGRAVAPGPFIDTALAAMAASRSTSPAVTEVVGRLADGRSKAAWAHHGGITAETQGDGYVLTGRATAVQAAGATDWLVVTTTEGAATRRILLVETATVGLERRRTLDESRAWYDVIFSEVQVPADNVIASGDAEVQCLVDAATMLTAADALGVGERLLEMTVDYVKVREQFDRPLGSFQSVKHKVADMLKTLKGIRAATYYAAMALDAGLDDAPLATSVAKAFTSEGASDIAGEALQTHGGIGFTWEHDLHLYLRRAKVDEVLYGNTAEHQERVLSLVE